MSFEEIRWSKKIDNFNETENVVRSLHPEILVEFVINFAETVRGFC